MDSGSSSSTSNCSNCSDCNSLQWLEEAEQRFDRAFVDLDQLLGDVEPDQMEITLEGRHKLTTLSCAFAQLSHRAQAIFQLNKNFQEELSTLKEQCATAVAEKLEKEKESEKLLLQVHSLQCQLKSTHVSNNESDIIRKKLSEEMSQFRSAMILPMKCKVENQLLTQENNRLRRMMSAMQNEIFGARLAAKYLDKELAGRIQQLQLLGKEIKRTEHDRLWNHLEAEIQLQRHKTVIRACKGRRKRIDSRKQPIQNGFDSGAEQKRKWRDGESRTVVINRENDVAGLGISITGGREHGVPILVSEIHNDLLDEGQIQVGDAILSVNGIDLGKFKHQEAVDILSEQHGSLTLELLYIRPETDSDDDSSNHTSSLVVQSSDGQSIDLYEDLSSNDFCAKSGTAKSKLRNGGPKEPL